MGGGVIEEGYLVGFLIICNELKAKMLTGYF